MLTNTTTIQCDELQNAVLELCKENQQLENVQVYEHTDGNTYIALEAGRTSELENLAKKIAGSGSKSQPVSYPTLELINQFMRNKDTKDTEDKLKYFKLEDITNSSSYIGKADTTIQIAISSNFKGFASVLQSNYEDLDGKKTSEKLKTFGTVIKSLMSHLAEITTGNYVDTSLVRTQMEKKIETSINEAKNQKQELLDDTDLIRQFREESLTINSINHKINYDSFKRKKKDDNKYDKDNMIKYSTLTVIIEKKMRVCLEILKRLLLFSYKNFEEVEGLEFQNKEKENANDATIKNFEEAEGQEFKNKEKESANDAIMRLNDKLDEFYKRTVVPSSEKNKIDFDPINIVVDDGYAPTKGSSLNELVQQQITPGLSLSLEDFSAWTITKDTTMFELISIIKSMSVYLRMML